MAITELKPIEIIKRNIFVAETTDTDFVAIDADAGAYFKMEQKDGKYALAVKNTVVVDDYYVEVASGTAGALAVVTSGATTGQINYNNADLVGPDGEALYSSNPESKNVLKISGTKTVVIAEGNDEVWGDLGDYTYELAPTKIAWINLDGARFKQMTGANKGKVLLSGGDGLLHAKVIRLP